jgi:sec-independent protein translocase protein TatC
MLLTPPDIISQTLLALPMWLLFEIGVLLARIMLRRQAENPETDFEDGSAQTELEHLEQLDDGPSPSDRRE